MGMKTTVPSDVGIDVQAETAKLHLISDIRVIAASIVLGAAALLILGTQPLLLGAFVNDGRLSEAGLGRIATLELMALATACVLGPRLMSGTGMRMRMLAAVLLLAIADALTTLPIGTAWISVLRGLAGLAEGFILAGAVTIQTHTHRPERITALFFAVLNLPQIFMVWLLPTWILPQSGAAGGFLLLAAIMAGVAPCALLLPRTVNIAARAPTARVFIRPLALLLIIAYFVQSAGNSAAWTFIERVAAAADLGGDTVGLALSSGIAANMTASLLVAAIAWRAPPLAVLIPGLILQAFIAYQLGRSGDATSYVALTIMFNAAWAFLLPFYIPLANRIDPSRTLAISMAGVGLFGISAGPFAGSLFVMPGDVVAAYIAASCIFVVAAATYCLVGMFIKRA